MPDPQNIQAAMTPTGETHLESQGLGLGGHQKTELLQPEAVADPYGLGAQQVATMPLPNVHAARIHAPDSYGNKVLGQKEITSGVHALFGKVGDSDATTIVSYHFDKDKFTATNAMEWMKEHASDHDFKFEPAKEESKRSEAVDGGNYDPSDLRIRSVTISPETWDDKEGRFWGSLATDAPIFSTDLRTGKPVHEVWRIDGITPDKHVPFLDNHKRDSVRNIIGSVRDTRPEGEHSYGGWFYVSSAEQDLRTKIREGHIKELSAGMQPRATTTIPPGKTMTVRCRSGQSDYTARSDQPLHVHTDLLLREVSLPVKGADSNTQIRSENQNITKETVKMTPQERSLCVARLGMPQNLNETQAAEWYGNLPEETRGALEKWAKEEESEEAHKRAEDEKKAKAKKAEEDEEARKRSAASSPESIRAEIDAALAEKQAAETARRDAIQQISQGVPEDVVRKALDDGMTVEQAGMAFLEAVRNSRTQPVGPYTQTHGADKDLTADVLGAALVIRSLDSLPSGEKGQAFASDPSVLLNRYRPNQFATNGIGEWNGNYPTRELTDEQRQRNNNLLNQAERYRNMSIPDLMLQCIRLDGRSVQGFLSHQEVVRAGLSGGSFGAIFTTNFNAMFLAGYLEATDSTMGWVVEEEAPNFMTGEIATVGKMNRLTLDGRNTPDSLTYGDWNEAIKVDRYSGRFEIDEKDLINDRFGVLQTNSPQEMGLAARRLRPDLIYSLLLGGYSAGTGRGPKLNQTGGQLFNTTAITSAGGHANMLAAADNDLYTPATGAVGIAGIQKALPAIASQRLNGVVLNLRPRFAIISEHLDAPMRTVFWSQGRYPMVATGSGMGGNLNPLSVFDIEIRKDARMDDQGTPNPLDNNKVIAGLKYHYILACRPGENGAKSLVCRYLQGSGRAPQITSYALNGANNDSSKWGMRWAVKHDIGVAAADFRGLYYAESST